VIVGVGGMRGFGVAVGEGRGVSVGVAVAGGATVALGGSAVGDGVGAVADGAAGGRVAVTMAGGGVRAPAALVGTVGLPPGGVAATDVGLVGVSLRQPLSVPRSRPTRTSKRARGKTGEMAGIE
jgi:hypothetical protein